MSRNQKSLAVFVAIIAALLAGTVLLGSYANIVPAKSDPGVPAEAENAAVTATCPKTQAHFAENAEGGCPRKAEAGSDATACPHAAAKTCGAAEATASSCEKSWPVEQGKPCGAGEAATGCSGEPCPSKTAGTCCGAKADAATE
jgi:hypothetical protein